MISLIFEWLQPSFLVKLLCSFFEEPRKLFPKYYHDEKEIAEYSRSHIFKSKVVEFDLIQ